MASEQSMKQVRLQALIEDTKTEIIAVISVNITSPVPAMSKTVVRY